jgi:tetratricopeptide (TPR) repeat protein
VLFHTGNLRDAEHHLEIATQLHKPEHAAYAKVALGTDPAAHALALLSAVCAHTGRVDRARALQKEGLARSIAAQNLISQCSVLICVLASYRLLEDGESLIDALKRLLEICGKCDLHESMTLFARYGEGLALTHDKNPEGALAKFDEAISGAKAIQMKYMLPIFTADRARAMGMAGRSDEAIVELREQIREATVDGHRSVLPELYLTLGQILAASGADRPSAEESLRAALEMSRDTGAHMLQLYALTTLAELHRDDDDWSGLRSELADAVAALTGGSDLPVVRRANALLGESSRRVAVGN